MKNDQKNSIYPSVPFLCMKNPPIHAVYMKTHLWHLKGLKLELHLNLWFKWISSKLNAKCIGSKSITYSCHIHASYCFICLCLIVDIVPSRQVLLRRVFQSTYLWSSAPSVDLPGKQTPLVHSDTIPLSRSCSLLLHQDNNDSTATLCCGS